MKDVSTKVYVCLTGVVATRYCFVTKDSGEKKEGVTYHVVIAESTGKEYTALYISKCAPDFSCHVGDCFDVLYYDRYGRVVGGVSGNK